MAIFDGYQHNKVSFTFLNLELVDCVELFNII
jgi:hypothetical protein